MSEYDRGDNGYDDRGPARLFSASVLGVAKESLLSRVPVGRGRTDVRDYDNDYSRGSSREKEQEPSKPMSAADITAIAETTVNQLMRRDEKRSQDNRERIRDREDRTERKSRERSQPAEKANPMSRLEKLKDPRIVTLKGLKAFHKEADIRRKLTDERMKFRDIRVIFNKASQSGTAFVEFMSDNEAARWVRHNRGMLKMSGEYLTMDLSKPLAAPKKDWVCLPCGEKNHHARETCYSCQSEKQEAIEKPRLRSRSPPDEFGREKSSASAPSNVLMFRGLDYRTTEDQVMRRLNEICDVAIRDVRLITDKYTNKSRGFCFVEVTSTEDGKALYTKITKMDPPFEIGSRKVNVSYQREPSAAKETNQAAQSAIAAAQWSAGAIKTGAPTTTVPAAIVEKPVVEDTAEAKMPLQVGSYVYDEKSGFYYDSASGLYYDPKTKYYYNPTDQQYYFWDATTNKYQSLTEQAAPESDTPAPGAVIAAKATVEESGKPATPKASKAMNAKKIQKDMERWAKAKNRQQAKAAPNRLEDEEEEALNVPLGNNIALKIAQGYAGAVSQPAPVPQPPQSSVFPITAISTAQPGLTDDQISRKYEDLTAMACLLCKRKFPSLDNLRRHQELSDLHQKSLAEEKLKNAGASAAAPTGSGYKDRAQERREKFGSEAPPPKKMGYHTQGGR